MNKVLGLLLIVSSLWITPVQAAVKGETVVYREGETALEGYVAFDPDVAGKRPAVIVVPDWMGVGDYVKKRTDQVAGLGYVAFTADIYGQGVRPKDAKEAGALATMYKKDRTLMRKRILAALAVVKARPDVDVSRVAVMGYCFGGTVALEAARSGADIVGAISFHGGLATPNPQDAKNIKAHVIAFHGADDPFVTPEEVAGFEKEMRDTSVDWQLVKYGNAVHSFTRPDAGNNNAAGAAYNANADRRSWQTFTEFLQEIFGR